MQAILPVLLFLAPAAQAYFILNHQTLIVERLDPIVQPGQVSQHMHTVVGGSQFSKYYDYATALTSQCTTAPVKIDFSNYWAPSLYYYNPSDSTFEAIPAGNVKTYYLQRPGSKNEKIVAPPAGLKMVAGSPVRRSFDAANFEDQAVSFVCLDYYNDHSGDEAWAQRNNFFEHNCPDGMRAQVFMPQCWDGVNLDSDDHKSHMAYPLDTFQGGNCPDTHPVHIIGIFYEFIFNVGDFPYNGPNEITWALANGDTTGYGFHADFTMGWPTEGPTGNVLQNAIDTCGLETGGDVSACAAFQPYLDFSGGCKPETPIVDELNGLGSPLSKLPGDNPLWVGEGPKPSNGDSDVPDYRPAKAVLPAGWSRTGCIAEGPNGRALSTATYSDGSMTPAVCASFCGDLGLPFAGVEYGTQCFCSGKTTNNGATGELVSDEQCNMACGGLDTDTCGGPNRLTLMSNPSLVLNETAIIESLPTGWQAGPCVTDNVKGRTLQGGYTADSKRMTNKLCVDYCSGKGFVYAGTSYSQECWCSNALTVGASVADDQSTCSMACKGDIRETCGGSNRLSLFFLPTNATTGTGDDFVIANGQLGRV